ncbi:uncharacterized protein LOC135331657 [Halichondria panicea]|uniref:uncharacterized protein LOC135331657 n=1 Tax=Halichondria panicea TaxID=6063 RepID=UPI00312B6A70
MYKMLQLDLLALLVTAGLLSLCMAETFYVAPTLPEIDCPAPCHTLDQFAQNQTLLAGYNNITLAFLEGVHNLNHTLYVVCEFNIILQPALLNQRPPPKVIGRSDGLAIRANALNILIKGLSFEAVIIVVIVNDDSEIEEHKVTIQWCDWFIGGLEVYVSGSINVTAEISDSSFNGHSVSKYGFYSGFYSFSPRHLPMNGYYSFTLQNSVFTKYTEYGIFSIFTKYTEYGIFSVYPYSSYITIKNATISQNRQGVHVRQVKELLIEDSKIFQTVNYGLYTFLIPNVTIVNSEISENSIGYASLNSGITLINSQIDSNEIGVALAMSNSYTDLSGLLTKMDHCNFTQNNVVGIWLLTYKKEEAIFRDCIFDKNRETPILAYQSTFQLAGETVFSNNNAKRGGALALYRSTVFFDSGSTTRFENNTATEFGGGIYIATAPPLSPQLLVAVENGIKTEDLFVYIDSFVTNRPCFYSSYASGDTQVKFFGNNAGFGGRDIFGLTRISYFEKYCSVSENSIFNFDNSVPSTFQLASDPSRVCFCVNDTRQCQNRAYLVVNETRFPGESFETSVALVGFNFSRVTGAVFATVLDGQAGNIMDSQRIQSINAYVECRKLTYTVLSNQTSRPLKLGLSVTDSLVQDNHDDVIKESVRSIYSPTCTDTSLYPKLPCTALLTTSIYINITVDNCPLGFQLNKALRVCECNKNTTQLELTCEIQNHTGYITRGGTVWVGMDTARNETDLYYWHQYCPSDYCNQTSTPVDLRSPGSQCSSNRAGILCGKCEDNYSLKLGSNRCEQCNNSFVALLIVFAILGILLVAMITLFDFTVASGTINGLIFYANIVWINNAILFPQQGKNIGYYIITVPIAWINLDFGIETCFSQNLDQLTKSGLQFVFPVYIWCIAGLIILASRYSIKATRFFGRNSVAVLSTLILLSYGKLFRIITNAFTKADITDSNGSIRKVWSLDGNVEYGITPGHIVLIVVALLFMLLFWLPFTLTLLLVPFLKVKSDRRPLRWINTFKPFFDSYYGPFKDKQQHQVWTGILLISRVVILIVFSSTSTFNPNANILVSTIIATLLLVYTAIVGYLYKQWFASVLEVLYLLNLIILGGAFLFYRMQPQDVQEMDTLNPVAATSVCFALFQFACSIIFHIAKKIGPKLQRLSKKKKQELDIESVPENAPDKVTTQVVELHENAREHKFTTQVVELHENAREHKFTMSRYSNTLREPLLEI